MEAIERRAAWVAISLALVVVFAGRGGFGYGTRIGGWGLFFNIVLLVCLGAAAALLVAALVPEAIRPLPLEHRARLAYCAFALWALALAVIVGFGIHATVETYRHPTGFP